MQNRDEKTKILSLSWRDIKSQKAGGAEVHTHEVLRSLNKNRYSVVHISTSTKGVPGKEIIDGIEYRRFGNSITVIIYAFFYYIMHGKDISYVIDQCNTHRFFTPMWVARKKRIFYIHQLTREIWDINARFPMNVIGKIVENPMLRLYRHDKTITVSHDTEKELRELGFDNDIVIIHNGVSFEPWQHEKWLQKSNPIRFIFAGRYSPYKGINLAVEAVARLTKVYPEVMLCILGKKDEKYVEEHIRPICKKYGVSECDIDVEKLIDNSQSSFPTISYLGYVSEENKLKVLSASRALLFPSMREGWGIPITEAGCVGTPSIVFNSPGLYEAVNYGDAGYVCANNSVEGIYEQLLSVCDNEEHYKEIQENAFVFSSQFKWTSIGIEVNKFFDSLVGYIDECEKN